MRIGIDFDNTLVDYDAVFAEAAREAGLLDFDLSGGKETVRAILRRQPDGETAWQRLQGRVYGALMPRARFVEGADEFLRLARRSGARILVVSHKTEFGHFDPEQVNLRDAARAWMTAHGFFTTDGFGLAPNDVFFEATREDKLRRLAALHLSHVIDDLPEVLADPAFPAGPQRLLLARGEAPPGPYRAFRHWADISREVLHAAT
jgi:hypothetical protein